jgi:hypothetical protein
MKPSMADCYPTAVEELVDAATRRLSSSSSATCEAREDAPARPIAQVDEYADDP